jgi:16S rRNA G966 N2-methylase RsmD
MGTLYYGDNLEILREHAKDGTVDLVYLDPPFNSNASYNVLRAPEGHDSHVQTEAFEETCHSPVRCK